jgi:hypothetical protein
MKKFIMLAAAATLLTGISMSSFASGKSLEERCKAQAEKHKIAADKLDAYVKTCVEKHMKHAKHAKHEKKAAHEPAAPAAPAATPTPAPDPAMPGMPGM